MRFHTFFRSNEDFMDLVDEFVAEKLSNKNDSYSETFNELTYDPDAELKKNVIGQSLLKAEKDFFESKGQCPRNRNGAFIDTIKTVGPVNYEKVQSQATNFFPIEMPGTSHAIDNETNVMVPNDEIPSNLIHNQINAEIIEPIILSDAMQDLFDASGLPNVFSVIPLDPNDLPTTASVPRIPTSHKNDGIVDDPPVDNTNTFFGVTSDYKNRSRARRKRNLMLPKEKVAARLFECPSCKKEFCHLKNLKAHTNGACSKLNEAENLIGGISQTKQFFAEEKNNNSTIHMVEQLFECSICEQTFTRSGNLKAHVRLYHKDENPFKCSVCKQTFSHLTKFTVHMRKHGIYSDDKHHKHFTCTICQQSFTYSYHLTRHMRVHTLEKNECSLCKRTFTCAEHLKHHMNFFHSDENVENSFKCSVCKQTFAQSSKLDVHMREHSIRIRTNNRPLNCIICQQTFSQNSNLNRHMRAHTGEKPFQCIICKATFTRSDNLTSHSIREHKDVKLYKCLTCDIGFAHSSQLKRHKCESIVM